MSRRRRAENPVSLFPFVAVMASTMGALILLLLVTARQAAKARDAAALQKGVAPAEPRFGARGVGSLWRRIFSTMGSRVPPKTPDPLRITVECRPELTGRLGLDRRGAGEWMQAEALAMLL